MNDIFVYGGVKNIPLYNCSARTSEQWSTETGEKHPVIGYLQIVYGLIVDILYIPIIKIMLEKDNMKLACFKIMFLLAVTDFFVILVNSILTGILGIQGAVYCTSLIYITGSMAMSFWCSSCLTSLILVCNRILVLSKPHIEVLLFENRKTYFILSISIIYGLYFLFTTPHVYNSKHHAWFFDPMIFPGRAKEYDNVSHSINNFSIVVMTCLLYIPFYSIVKQNLKAVTTQSRAHNSKLQVFIQSALICGASQIAAIIYVIMNLTTVFPAIIIFGHVLWQIVHGAPVLIYITLNDMIRKRFFEIIRFRKVNATTVISVVNPSTVVVI